MIFMWENRFNERTDSPLFLDHWKRLKKFQIFITMGIRIFVIVIGRVVECRERWRAGRGGVVLLIRNNDFKH